MKINDNTSNEDKPLLSISIPVLNEESNLDALHERLIIVGKSMEHLCDLEFIFTDNYSTDSTWIKLEKICSKDKRCKAIRFSRNFGFQRSILANYMHTSGDAVVQIDADLQDPPELIKVFFQEWKKGYDVVYGIRTGRSENILSNYFRKIGYWIIDKLSDYPIPRNAGDFRLIDRKVLDVLFKIKHHNPYLRGVIAGLGFKQKGIDYNRESRSSGKSKFNLFGLVRMGTSAVLSHSTMPLRLASVFGLIVLLISICGAIYYTLLKFLDPNLPQGLASIHILVLFGIGLHSLFMGIIGEYLLKIYLIIRSHPLVVIERHLNFKDEEIQF
tara:strand:+ start:457 stop:1440 length:984 start_codon:yes stop_codon:yes gene_type:complete